MSFIFIILSTMLIGYLCGWKMRERHFAERLIDPALLVLVGVMILIMGMRLSSKEEVIANIGQIGIIASVITVLLWIGGMLAVTLTRKCLGIDRYGWAAEEREESEAAEAGPETQEGDGGNAMTIDIVVSVTAGLLIGFFWIRTHLDPQQYVVFDTWSTRVMLTALTMMVFLIGYSMGLTGTVIREFKKAGKRAVLIGLAVIAGTAVTAVLCGLLFREITVRESLAVSLGFGWYTYAPVLIESAGHEIAGAISFLHNVLRELIGIILIPILARRVGYIEINVLPGIACMDVAMPIVRQATRDGIIAYAFIIGFFEELTATFLLPGIIGV